MWRQRVEAHPGPMFNSYEITRALVSERQHQLRREAARDRLARRVRGAVRRTDSSTARIHRLPVGSGLGHIHHHAA